MRNPEIDEQWIREQVRAVLSSGASAPQCYLTPNHYDGGYEVRVGTRNFFVDYESIDANDAGIIAKHLSNVCEEEIV